MRNVFVALAVVLAVSTAQAGTIYHWVDANGVLGFADELKKVPARHKDQVAVYEIDREINKVVSPSTALLRLKALRAMASTSIVSPTIDCGPVTFRSERRDVDGGYNTRFYIAEDKCGVLSDLPYYPEVNIIR